MTSRLGGVLVSTLLAGATRKRITCPVVSRIRRLEVDAGSSAAERLVRAEVLQDDLGP
jgi:hypothetical protein